MLPWFLLSLVVSQQEVQSFGAIRERNQYYNQGEGELLDPFLLFIEKITQYKKYSKLKSKVKKKKRINIRL